MKAQDLVGVWHLNGSFEIEDHDGKKTLWRNSPHGLLIYTEDGHMSVSINAAIEAHPDKKHILDHVIFYAGRYEFKEPDTVTHHVTNATDLDRIGTNLERKVSLKENTLEIVGQGKHGKAILVWEKEKK